MNPQSTVVAMTIHRKRSIILIEDLMLAVILRCIYDATVYKHSNNCSSVVPSNPDFDLYIGRFQTHFDGFSKMFKMC